MITRRSRPVFSGLALLAFAFLFAAPIVRARTRAADPQASPALTQHPQTFELPFPDTLGPGMFADTLPGVPRNAVAGVRPSFGLTAEAAASRVFSPPPEAFRLFEPTLAFTTTAEARAVGIGDFNQDGRNDVAVTTGLPENLLYVFTQTISATLAAPITITAGMLPDSLAVGDFNNDGRDDVAVANFGADSVGVYLQAPLGGLTGPVAYATDDGPNALAVGDLNQDGLDDLAVSHQSAGVVGIFLQRLDGTLEALAAYPAPQAGWDDLSVGDVNNDGRQDLVKMNGQFLANPNLSVYLQDAGGVLQPAIPYDSGNEVGNGVAVGDVSGDGLDDVVMSVGGNRPYSHLTVFTQTITGTFNVITSTPALDVPEAFELADLNLDGHLDAVTVHGGWSTLSVHLGGAAGGLLPYQSYELPAPGAGHYLPQSLAVGDINSDGLPDAVVADGSNGLLVLYHVNQHLQLFPFVRVPLPETDVPLADDFSDSSSGWPNFVSLFADFLYLNDEYQILSKQDIESAFATAGHRRVDLDVQVTARRVGNVTGAYGIVYGFENALPIFEYTAFVVQPELQQWTLFRFVFGGGGFMDVFWGVTSDIVPGEGNNRLRVRRQGDDLSLWVNGVQVFGTVYPAYSGSRTIGLLQAPDGASFDVRFDDYLLDAP